MCRHCMLKARSRTPVRCVSSIKLIKKVRLKCSWVQRLNPWWTNFQYAFYWETEYFTWWITKTVTENAGVLAGSKTQTAHALLIFDTEEGKRHTAIREIQSLFCSYTLLTDCSFGMVEWTQTACRPGMLSALLNLAVIVPVCHEHSTKRPVLARDVREKKENLSLKPGRENRNRLGTQTSLPATPFKMGEENKEWEMGINKEMTTDRRYEERLAVIHEKTAGSDILQQTWRRKQNDGSNLERRRKGEGVWRTRVAALDNAAFVSRLLC